MKAIVGTVIATLVAAPLTLSGPWRDSAEPSTTLQTANVPYPSVSGTPRYRVIVEDNDPSGRIMVLANHNSDLTEYREHSGQGYFPVDPTNDGFRLGISNRSPRRRDVGRTTR